MLSGPRARTHGVSALLANGAKHRFRECSKARTPTIVSLPRLYKRRFTRMATYDSFASSGPISDGLKCDASFQLAFTAIAGWKPTPCIEFALRVLHVRFNARTHVMR